MGGKFRFYDVDNVHPPPPDSTLCAAHKIFFFSCCCCCWTGKVLCLHGHIGWAAAVDWSDNEYIRGLSSAGQGKQSGSLINVSCPHRDLRKQEIIWAINILRSSSRPRDSLLSHPHNRFPFPGWLYASCTHVLCGNNKLM